MHLNKRENPYTTYFTRQEASILKRKPVLQHEAELLRVLIHRILAAASESSEPLSINEQVKLYTLLLRAISTLVGLQRGAAAAGMNEEPLAELLESLHKELQE